MLKQGKAFNYLGCTISDNRSNSEEVRFSRSMARFKFGGATGRSKYESPGTIQMRRPRDN
jgi:hypothetical protein